jgi:hypothetical protein
MKNRKGLSEEKGWKQRKREKGIKENREKKQGRRNLLEEEKDRCQKDECLDWKNSQFINIVGKDDVFEGFEVTGTEVA